VQAIDLSQSLAPSAAPAIGLVTVDRKELLAALAFVGKVAERKSTMPCLSWVRLCAHGGALTCETTDLYTAARVVVGATWGAFTACTPVGELAAALKAIDAVAVSFACDGATLAVTYDGARVPLEYHAPDDFPPCPFESEGDEFSPWADEVAAAFAATLPCVSDDKTRPHLNSLLLERNAATGALCTVVATDGHRLAKVVLGPAGDAAPVPYLVSKRAALAIGDMVARTPAGALARFTVAKLPAHTGTNEPRTLIVKVGPARTLTTRLVDAQFPPYGQVIPQGDGETRLTFDRATLARALKSAAAVASKHTGGVVLDAMGPTVMLSATRDGATATLPLPCVDRQGATMAIGFNAGYWRDFLASIPKAGPSEITVKFGGELAPMVSMVDVSPEARLTWVCMPMRR